MTDPLFDHLQGVLQSILGSAHLSAQRLPQCPEIGLYLINEDFSNAALTPDEARAVMDMPSYWIFCWASGQALARYLLDHPERVRGRVVVDFGAGSGVVAIACAMAGARKVYACDLDVDARRACQLNARLNGVEVVIVADMDEIAEPVELITVADVLYDRANLPLLDAFLGWAPEALVADSRVKSFDHPRYRFLATLESCTLPDLDELDEFRHVRFYEGRRGG